MIKTQVIGHLGNDAKVNDVNGKTVINFSVAHSASYTNGQGQKIENTIWVNCSWWIESIAVAQYLVKGKQVYVEGVPSLDTYRNNANVVIPQLNLRVEVVQLLSNKDN